MTWFVLNQPTSHFWGSRALRKPVVSPINNGELNSMAPTMTGTWSLGSPTVRGAQEKHSVARGQAGTGAVGFSQMPQRWLTQLWCKTRWWRFIVANDGLVGGFKRFLFFLNIFSGTTKQWLIAIHHCHELIVQNGSTAQPSQSGFKPTSNHWDAASNEGFASISNMPKIRQVDILREVIHIGQ